MSLSTEEWEKKYAWKETKRGVSDTLERSFPLFRGPVLNVKTDWRKKPRIGSFTDSDVDELKSVMEDDKEKDEAIQRRRDQHLEQEKQRWEKLKQKWARNEEIAKEKGGELKRYYRGDSEEKPGIFRVSQNLNCEYDTFDSFVGVFKTEGDARSCHPLGGDACVYKESELERNESWCLSPSPFFGPAPGWYLGRGDTWVHGAYVKVERLSDYVPPEGTEPKYGLWTTSFNAG